MVPALDDDDECGAVGNDLQGKPSYSLLLGSRKGMGFGVKLLKELKSKPNGSKKYLKADGNKIMYIH
jgi:hypothetical protein